MCWSRTDPHTWFTWGSKLSATAVMIKAPMLGLLGTEPQHQQTLLDLHQQIVPATIPFGWLINVTSNLSYKWLPDREVYIWTSLIIVAEQEWLDWEAATGFCSTNILFGCCQRCFNQFQREASANRSLRHLRKPCKNNPVCQQILHFNMFVQQRNDNSWEQTVSLIVRQISKYL